MFKIKMEKFQPKVIWLWFFFLITLQAKFITWTCN